MILNIISGGLAAAETSQIKPVSDREGKWRCKMILHIEDQEPILTGLQEILILRSYNVCSAPSLKDGLQHYQFANPDLVIIGDDYLLERNEGLAPVAEIRKLNPNVPIILHRAITPDGELPPGVHYVEKGRDNQILLDSIGKLLEE